MTRFTKKVGRRNVRPPQPRLSVKQHEAYALLIRGGDRARPGRMRAWARALEKHLQGPEKIDSSDLYAWIVARTRSFRRTKGGALAGTMTFDDASKIFVAGVRARDPLLESPLEWQQLVHETIPSIITFHYGYGIDGKSGRFGVPFVPVMMPLEYIPHLAEDFADLAVIRDRSGKRRRVGERIERFLRERAIPANPTTPGWSFSAAYAVRELVMLVLFERFYKGRLGRRTAALDAELTEIGLAVERELRRTLLDDKPRAFDRLFDRLRDRVDKARPDEKRVLR